MILVSAILDISSFLDLSLICAFVNILNEESNLVRQFIKSRQYSYLEPMRTVMSILLFFSLFFILIRFYYVKTKTKFWTLRSTRFFVLFKILQLSGVGISFLMLDDIYLELTGKYAVLQYAIDKENTSILTDRMGEFQNLLTINTVFAISCLSQTAALFYKSGKLEKEDF